MEKANIEKACLTVLKTKALDIRNVPAKVTNEEVKDLSLENQPFLYTSGNWGPGYVTIKSLVGRKEIIKALIKQLAWNIAEKALRPDFVAGNVSGGVIPAWLLSEELEKLFGRTVPFVYIREAKKKGGQKELVVGIDNNPEIPTGANGLIVEELVNFARTICNGADALRDLGYPVTHAATILFYDNPEAVKAFRAHRIEIAYLFTLPELLAVAEKYQTHLQEAIDDYRKFLTDPFAWQTARGLRRAEEDMV